MTPTMKPAWLPMGSTDLRARIRDALDADDHRYPHARMPSDVRELLQLVLEELERLNKKHVADLDKAVGEACQYEHERTVGLRRDLRSLRAELAAMTLRERIRAAMEMRLGFIQECRELLPLVLAELDALRTELAECRAQNTSMAETMSGIRSNAVQLAAMTAERDELRADLETCQRAHYNRRDAKAHAGPSGGSEAK